MNRRSLVTVTVLIVLSAFSLRWGKDLSCLWQDERAPALFDLSGRSFTVPAGSSGAAFALTIPGAGRVTAGLSARAANRERLILDLVDPSGRGHRIARSFGMRDRTFDLTPFIGSPGAHELRLRSEKGGAFEVTAITIRQAACRSYPPAGWLALLLAALGVFLRKEKAIDSVNLGVAVGAIAFAVRWSALAGTVGQPLVGDAVFYQQIADGFSIMTPFVTGMREPAMVWMIRFINELGGGAFAVRLMTAVFSAATAGLLVFVGEGLIGSRLAGSVAGFIFALGDFQVWNAVRGERSEPYVFLLCVFVAALIASRRSSALRWDAALGLIGAALGLTWLIGAAGAVLAYAIRLAPLEKRAARSALFATCLLIPLVPHFVSQARVNGDPFFAMNAHANFYRSAEATGVPTYAGERHSMASLMVQGPVRRVRDAAAGYASFFLNPSSPYNRIFLGFHYNDGRVLILYPFLVAGLLLAFRRQEWALLWALIAFLNVSPALARVVRDPRLFLFAAPFVALFTGSGIAAAIDGAGRLARRGKSKRSV